ncbi:unnamed protein product [Pleuronectes platessa]|uniref:Uncharacterized protein n=1 Tax=Pleuronectes platessa TaxID=8262 RepID=A0A9N7TPW9_PLEPL|nr:unnamed protein product [Pleuronectes platessa]
MEPALKFPSKIKHGDSISIGEAAHRNSLAGRASQTFPFHDPHSCDTAVNPCRTKHHSVAEETRPNSVPRAKRIRSISGPSTKPLQQMNQRYPARAMTSSPNSGDSLTACTPRNTTRDSLDFWKIRATRKQHHKGHTCTVSTAAAALLERSYVFKSQALYSPGWRAVSGLIKPGESSALHSGMTATDQGHLKRIKSPAAVPTKSSPVGSLSQRRSVSTSSRSHLFSPC